MTTTIDKRQYFEIIASSICGLLFISLFILELFDFSDYSKLIAFLAFSLVFILLIFYAFTALSTPFTLTIGLSSVAFVGAMFKFLHLPGYSLIIMLGSFFEVLAIPILGVLIIKKYLKQSNKNKLQLLLFRLLTIYLIVKLFLIPVLKFYSINFDFLFLLPVIFLLSFFILHEDFQAYHISIKNGIKVLLLLHLTLFCLKMIARTSENYSHQQHLTKIGALH